MTEDNRLPAPAGLLIDREAPVAFTFEGTRYEGCRGDTIASALAANGRWVLSRSFKYHRPRGVLSMAGQDGNTLVQLPGEPNVLADREPIAPDLAVMGQNYFGSLERDRASLLGLFGRFMPVGFYYKAFYKPFNAFKYWEWVIRKIAGLGKVDLKARHGYYDKSYGFCDVAVIGGGPAGMSAALEAAKAGAEVILVEENPVLGGSLTYARFDEAGERGEKLRRKLTARIEANRNITIYTDAVAQALFADNWLPVTQANRMYKIRAAAVVAATGAMEQHAVFRNNDLPGVMMGSAAQRLIRLYGVRPGRRAVLIAGGDEGYKLAFDLADAGVEVAAIVDPRVDISMTPVTTSAVAHRFRLLAGYGPVMAHAAPGNRHVTGLTVAALGADRQPSGVSERIECDLVCMSTGYAPNAALIYHAGGRLAYDDETAMFAVQSLPAHLFAAGSVNGAWELDAVLAEGRHAGWAAARDCGLKPGAEPKVPAQRGGAGRSHPWPMFPHENGKDFVDFDEDLQYRDIVNATLDGYDDIQLLKRYSTVGMGPSQGRHSSVASVRIAAQATGRQVNEVGTTTSRPPVGPQKLSQLAGRIFEPIRRTAMHHRHLEAGAQMMVAGMWLRPAYYGAPGEREAAILREVAAVHEAVGIIDVSTLGGLEVRGPDAPELMNRMFTFGYLKQPVGRARYVLLCDENGVISDDGIACRLHDQHYYVTATTSGAESVYRTMLWFNAQWRLDVDVTNGTAAFCGVNLAGPKSREVLAGLCDDLDLSPEGFGYMGVREGHVAGIRCRLLRVGFVGELGYELHPLSDQGEALWDALMAAGAAHGIKPFGIEAQRVLRLEKGHIIIGQDSDGLTTPHEAAMGWAVSSKKPYFVGMRAIMIQNQGGLERQLVGFTMVGERPPLPAENHLVIRDGAMVGRVTSAARSIAVGATIGLAYVAPDQVKPGTQFEIRVAGGRLAKAEVATLPFYDPGNKRQEM